MIDFTLPVETDETPPRPVRVLTQFDWNGDACTLVEMPNGLAMVFTAEGKNLAAGVTLRNVAPPKPEPVMWTAWLNLTKDGVVVAHADEDEADEEMTANAAGFHTFVERRAIQWMSDGSPVEDGSSVPPMKMGMTRQQLEHEQLKDDYRARCEELSELGRERDHWRAKAEALQAEVERLRTDRNACLDQINALNDDIEDMRPVVEAAVAWADAKEGPIKIYEAVRAYQSAAIAAARAGGGE